MYYNVLGTFQIGHYKTVAVAIKNVANNIKKLFSSLNKLLPKPLPKRWVSLGPHVAVGHVANGPTRRGAMWQWGPTKQYLVGLFFFSKLCLFDNGIKMLHELLPFQAKARPKILTSQNCCHCIFSACCNNLWAFGNVFVILLKAIYGRMNYLQSWLMTFICTIYGCPWLMS